MEHRHTAVACTLTLPLLVLVSLLWGDERSRSGLTAPSSSSGNCSATSDNLGVLDSVVSFCRRFACEPVSETCQWT